MMSDCRFHEQVVTFSATRREVLLMEAHDMKKTRHARAQMENMSRKKTEVGWRGNKCMEDGNMGRREDTNERWKPYKSLLSDENAASLRRLLFQCILKSTQRAFQQVSRIVFMLPMNFSWGNCKTPFTFSSSRKQHFFPTAGKHNMENMNDQKNKIWMKQKQENKTLKTATAHNKSAALCSYYFILSTPLCPNSVKLWNSIRESAFSLKSRVGLIITQTLENYV